MRWFTERKPLENNNLDVFRPQLPRQKSDPRTCTWWKAPPRRYAVNGRHTSRPHVHLGRTHRSPPKEPNVRWSVKLPRQTWSCSSCGAVATSVGAARSSCSVPPAATPRVTGLWSIGHSAGPTDLMGEASDSTPPSVMSV